MFLLVFLMIVYSILLMIIYIFADNVDSDINGNSKLQYIVSNIC